MLLNSPIYRAPRHEALFRSAKSWCLVLTLVLGVAAPAAAAPRESSDPQGWASSSSARREIAARVGETVTAPHEIEIDLRYGLCVLTGTVATERDRELVEGIARSQRGVREVRNELMVGAPSATSPSETTARIERRLGEERTLDGYQVKVSFKDGIATLRGETNDAKTRDAIEHLVASTDGVNQVKSFLEIAAPPDDAALQRALHRALAENRKVDLDSVSFDVRDGVAEFRGNVARHEEIDRILAVALMVEGIRDIKSEVRVSR